MPAPQAATVHATVLFDGECGLCAQTVRFVQRRDRQARFHFTALQSAAGQMLLRQHHLPTDRLDSVVLLEDGAVFTRSTAALRICRRLSGAWPLLALFLALPRSWRDRVYGAVARRRHLHFPEVHFR
ncbi:MAG: DUF393 domain-containing protein [Opitutaceae bacterium]|nr:DUF393 domain-containing protein [Opitutaceae bacterium]